MQPIIRLSPPAKGGRAGSAWSEPVASKRTAGHSTDGTGTRLLYYIQESNKVEGYMREACFSPDGRVICSPHDDYGVRLLAFNEYKSIVLFDPLAEKQVSAVSNAHDGSVNCIK